MRYNSVEKSLVASPKKWLITGVAGFIGSNLLEELLKLDQEVVGIDNFLTGHKKNLDNVKQVVGEKLFDKFTFIEGSVTDKECMMTALKGVDYVLHQAALGSVPRSIDNPLPTDDHNIHGFVNTAFCAKESGVKRVVYASSSSVYGDCDDKIKTESRIGTPLSPYAVSKSANELYAHTFAPLYNMEFAGLRYFNVFGARQDPNGVYSAVIPRWLGRLLNNERCSIYGDGLTSRDFCYIKNVVQANVLAATQPLNGSNVFNVACGQTTTLIDLYKMIASELSKIKPDLRISDPIMEDFRAGDIRASLADISNAKKVLGYFEKYSVTEGMKETVKWYAENLSFLMK